MPEQPLVSFGLSSITQSCASVQCGWFRPSGTRNIFNVIASVDFKRKVVLVSLKKFTYPETIPFRMEIGNGSNIIHHEAKEGVITFNFDEFAELLSSLEGDHVEIFPPQDPEGLEIFLQASSR